MIEGRIDPDKVKLARLFVGAALLAVLSPLAVPLAMAQEGAANAPRANREQAGSKGASNGVSATAEEEAKTVQFMEQFAPERFRVFKASREGPAKKQFGQFLVNRWRRLEELRMRSPQLYQVRVDAIHLDDEIFSICRQMKKANTADKQKLLADLKSKVADLVDNGLKERQIRISELQAQLKQQNDLLEADTSRRDELIARRYRQISTQGVAGARLDNSPNRNTVAAPNRKTTTPAIKGISSHFMAAERSRLWFHGRMRGIISSIGMSEIPDDQIELAEDAEGVLPRVDSRPRIPEPLPVRLATVDDAHLCTVWGREAPLDEFYVKLLQFERASNDRQIIYRADNARLTFEVVTITQPRETLRPLVIEVRSLARIEHELIEQELDYTRQKGVAPGSDSLLLMDPAGNWIELQEARLMW